ncbi:hypothetical protein B4923_17110 [Brenneria roseae subsp. americana]|uniref:OmpR/PhoB-type domain-containing protein n=1 Tax=Brenneria roseae subsp. americana TaxID=1508507 RepID=A0A2U1TL47_9GAMM|nr:winged helix-turn-helix domain-containing protein [Brenneria roseae]PWC10154.1 hypothetical protein B4923_17110 [Brenneria roseae subsp. americana]
MAEKYFINQTVVFSSINRTICFVDIPSSENILSPPVSNLLIYLIKNNNTVLSKEKILSECMEPNGFSPSINNLNNYLSILRKALRPFSLDESIQVIPKVGIKFLAQISSEENEIINDRPKSSKKIIVGSLALVASFLLLLFYSKESIPRYDYKKNYSLDGCDLLTDGVNIEKNERITKLCNPDSTLFFKEIQSPNENNDFTKIILISTCKKGVTDCENYTYIY